MYIPIGLLVVLILLGSKELAGLLILLAILSFLWPVLVPLLFIVGICSICSKIKKNFLEWLNGISGAEKDQSLGFWKETIRYVFRDRKEDKSSDVGIETGKCCEEKLNHNGCIKVFGITVRNIVAFCIFLIVSPFSAYILIPIIGYNNFSMEEKVIGGLVGLSGIAVICIFVRFWDKIFKPIDYKKLCCGEQIHGKKRKNSV